jgi:peptidoglycan/LPS O-acetylase OafA/YrhL
VFAEMVACILDQWGLKPRHWLRGVLDLIAGGGALVLMIMWTGHALDYPGPTFIGAAPVVVLWIVLARRMKRLPETTG